MKTSVRIIPSVNNPTDNRTDIIAICEQTLIGKIAKSCYNGVYAVVTAKEADFYLMVTIAVTPDELSAGKLTSEHLQEAVKAVYDDGIVILKDVINLEHIQILREKMTADVELLINRPDAPFNWNTGNVQQDPPPFTPYLFRDVLVNDLVIEVTNTILGPGMYNSFYSGNTALKSESRQPVHADNGHLWRNAPVAAPPHQIVVNVPLVDVSSENGATEIWPGTHKDLTVSIYDPIELTDEHLEKWRTADAPLQPVVSAGSVIIRDMRLWHAGMPNHTDIPRPMIAMIHQVKWMGKPGALRVEKGTEEFFTHPDLDWVVEYVDEPIDHIRTPHGYKSPLEK